MTNLIKAGLALSFLVAIVVVECAAKKQPKPEPDPAFTVVENISVLPIVDARSGQKAEVNLEKLQEGIVRRLQKKRYTAAAANTTGDTKEIAIEDVEAADPSYVKKLGPTGERWVMVVFLDDVNSKMAHSKINFGSAGNAELVRSLGADRVIDYAKEDFTQGAARYDVILDMAGSHSFSARKRVMTSRGICVGVGILAAPKSLLAMIGGLIRTLVDSRFSRQKYVFFMAKANREDLTFLGEMLASGKLRSAIDKRYTLDEVPEAMRYQGTWRARGKLLINVETR